VLHIFNEVSADESSWQVVISDEATFHLSGEVYMNGHHNIVQHVRDESNVNSITK
jgi:hypothetical protein